MTLDALNVLNRRSFTGSLGWVFEHSPWVAERAWAGRPFSDLRALHRAMVLEVERAAPEEQLKLLRAHPDLGARERLSQASASEQAGAGLDGLTREELDLFTEWNDSYRRKFGFPFLFAVKGSTRRDVLRALERRLSLSRDEEYAEALRQVYQIAEFRLNEYLIEES